MVERQSANLRVAWSILSLSILFVWERYRTRCREIELICLYQRCHGTYNFWTMIDERTINSLIDKQFDRLSIRLFIVLSSITVQKLFVPWHPKLFLSFGKTKSLIECLPTLNGDLDCPQKDTPCNCQRPNQKQSLSQCYMYRLEKENMHMRNADSPPNRCDLVSKDVAKLCWHLMKEIKRRT